MGVPMAGLCALFLFFVSLASGRSVAECVALTQLLDLEHVTGGRPGDFVARACQTFSWLGVEYRSHPRSYDRWIRHEQYGLALEDVLANAPLRHCFRRFLGDGNMIDFWQDVQNFRALAASVRTHEFCRMYEHYVRDLDLSGRVKSELKERSHLHCSGGLDPLEGRPIHRHVLDMAQYEARHYLRRYLHDFMQSGDFRSCDGRHAVARDVGDFSQLQRRYCEDEGRSYDGGDKTRRERTLEAVRRSMAERCKEDPDFDVSHI